MDNIYNSRLQQRLFLAWAHSTPLPGNTRPMDQLQLDRLRGHIAAEGYGDGGSANDVLYQPVTLPEAPDGCNCSACMENITTGPLVRHVLHGLRLMQRCEACGDLVATYTLSSGVCRECRGVE